jgi:hypothetical protein
MKVDVRLTKPVCIFPSLDIVSLQENVNRLKAYKSNLVVFPRHRNSKKPKVGGMHLNIF